MDSLLEQRIQYLERLLSTKTRSPIVVQLASLYLEAGRPHDALRYCDNAIAHFPYYTTAYLIRAKVLQALEMKAEARRDLEFVQSILSDVVGVKTMLEQIPTSDIQTFQDAGTSAAEAPPPDAEPTVEDAHQTAVEESTGTVSSVGSQEEPDTVGGQISQEQLVIETSGSGDEPRDVVREEDPFGLGAEAVGVPAAEPALSVDFHEPPEAPEDLSIETRTAGDVDVPALPAGVESYEQFATRMSEELAGSGDTLTLEEFFAPTTKQVQQEPKVDHIEELAEKLKSAPRITPIIDIKEKKAIPPSEEDTPASTEFVTPTLAEIYAKQGWYDDAIIAYKTLARIKPAERERFEKRVQELEQLKKAEGGGS